MGGHLRRQAHAGVADDELHVAPGGGWRGDSRLVALHGDHLREDRQHPAERHRVAGVDREVEQDLLQSARVDPHRARSDGCRHDEADPVAEGPRQHRPHPGQHVVHLDDLVTTGESAGEGEQLLRQCRSALGGPADLGEVAPGFGVAVGRLLDRLGVAQDDRHEVVEVVRDPAGEPADALQPLDLAQTVLVTGHHEVGHREVGQHPGAGEVVLRPRSGRPPVEVQRAPRVSPGHQRNRQDGAEPQVGAERLVVRPPHRPPQVGLGDGDPGRQALDARALPEQLLSAFHRCDVRVAELDETVGAVLHDRHPGAVDVQHLLGGRAQRTEQLVGVEPGGGDPGQCGDGVEDALGVAHRPVEWRAPVRRIRTWPFVVSRCVERPTDVSRQVDH